LDDDNDDDDDAYGKKGRQRNVYKGSETCIEAPQKTVKV
jgi:hypothetical protein